MSRMAVVVVALLAALACNVCLAEEAPVEQLRDPKLMDLLTSEQVFGLLKRALAEDPKNGELRALLDARQSIKLARCSMEYQQWLIRQLLQHKRTPLAIYLADVRIQYRTKCTDTYKARLELALMDLDYQQILNLGELAKYLDEFKQMHEVIYKVDDLPLNSLASALKAYLEEKVESKVGADLKVDAHRQQAIEELRESCEHLTGTLGDFLWSLRLIDRPDLGSEGERVALEQMLFATKICKSLQFETYETQLELEYRQIDVEERALVRKFVNLLRVPDRIWMDDKYALAPESIEQALEKLTDEQHYLNTKGAAPFELAQQLIEELKAACASHLKAMNDFLWLIDVQFLEVSPSSGTVGLLKRARVCALTPFHLNA